MKSRIWSFLLFIVLFPFGGTCETQPIEPSLIIDANYPENQYLPALKWVLKEGNVPLTEQHLIGHQFADAQYIELSKKGSFAYDAHTNYWFKIQFQNNDDINHKVLGLYRNGNGMPWGITFDKIDMFLVQDNKLVKLGSTGTSVPASKRDEPEIFFPTILSLDKINDSKCDVWIRFKLRESFVLKPQLKLLNKHGNLGAEQNLTRSFILMVAGAVIVFLIISFFFYVNLRENIYLWYIIFLVAFITDQAYLGFVNSIFRLVFPEHPLLLIFFFSLVSIGFYISLLQIWSTTITTFNAHKRINKYIKYCMSYMLGFAIVNTWLRLANIKWSIWSNNAHIFLGLGFVPLLVMAGYLLIKGKPLVKYMSGGVFVLSFVMLAGLIMVNISQNTDQTHQGILRAVIGFSIVIAISLSIIYRYILLNRQKEEMAYEKLGAENNAKSLKELDIAKTEFFTNINHELRTPLSLMVGPIENVLHDEKNNLTESAKALLNLSLKNAEKLKIRVNEILDLSKLEEGKMDVSLVPVKLIQLVQEIVQSFESLAQKKEVRIVLNTALGKDLTLFTDLLKIEKIIINLIDNALKHSPEKGVIQVHLFNENNTYHVEISDQGKGINETEVDKIFERFAQTEEGKIKGGSGIGLPLSQGLAKLLGGDIKVRTNIEGGATFDCTFTAEKYIEQVEKEAVDYELPTNFENESLVEWSSKIDDYKYTVMVVEDNVEIRQFIKSTLQTKFKILEAANGNDALQLLQSERIDLITSDVMMPQMNGFELVKQIKSDERYKNIPVIMLTSLADNENKLEALQMGVDDYLNKPFYARELLARISNILTNLENRKLHNSNSTEEIVEENIEPEWLLNIKETITKKIDDRNLSRTLIADLTFTTEKTLDRKLLKTIGISCSDYIKEIRLNIAQKLVQTQKYSTLKEISNAVGYSNPHYFNTEFYKRFGKKVSDYF
ncbi:MAG: response regulator [Flavobacteriales bacterium]|nr:response regulator [Flavobacteriales bacterium]